MAFADPLQVTQSVDARGANTTTFVDNLSLPVHRWFRYSAGFSAEWVRSMLEDTSDAQVLDPFVGSGTTLLAAQQAGAESIGIENHPFVGRVARAKLRWGADPAALTSRAERVLATHRPRPSPAPVPTLLTKCYTADVLADLVGLRHAIESESAGEDDDHASGDLLWLALVGIARATSHVGTAQWQYVLPNKRKRSATDDVLGAFRSQVALMADDMRLMQATIANPPETVLVEGDCREPSSSPGWATHVICSPPYANNYDYADATRLEQTLLGEVAGWRDLKPIRAGLIRSCSQAMGGYDPAEALADPMLAPIADELHAAYRELDDVRHSHGGRKAYHLMVLAYFHDLARVWISLRGASATGATVCFVIGDSAPYGVHLPVERWLGALAVSAGFTSWEFEKVRDRNMKWKNRKHDVPLHEGRLWVEG